MPPAASPPLTLAFINENVVAVVKPPGWLSVPSRLGRADPRPCVGTVLSEQLAVRLWPLHRLDEEVGGLLLFARSAEAHRALGADFEARRLHKFYSARSEAHNEGRPPPDAPIGERVRWTCLLLRGKKRAYLHPAGKESVTFATLLETDASDGTLTWRLEPHSGRGHQLRVELARRGCPILGDRLYGATRPYPPPGIALRAVALDLSASQAAARLGLPPQLALPSDMCDLSAEVTAHL